MTDEPPLSMDEDRFATLAEIAQWARSEIMREVYRRLAPEDVNAGASLYALTVGLMLGDLAQAMLHDLDNIVEATNDMWQHAGWPLRIGLTCKPPPLAKARMQ
jgi:hypothetical protein